MTRVAVGFVRAYQKILSPMLPGACRFSPTCSEYAIIALQRHGFLRGFWLSAKRLVRCRPGPGGGFGVDLVP